MEWPTSAGETLFGFIRSVRPLYAESSLSAALDALRESSFEFVPVLEGPFLVGVLWADDARMQALSGKSLAGPIGPCLDKNPPRLLPNDTLTGARTLLASSGRPALVITDPEQRYLGVFGALDLFQRASHHQVRPPFIGGMATPFGVFLTNGEVSGGAKPLALVSTGALLFSILCLSVIVTTWLLGYVEHRLSANAIGLLMGVLPTAFFFCALRAIPLSGTHGAEHMVVHAVERREQLTPEIVRRMPRIHPRCGTNFAIGAMVFTGLVQWSWPTLGEIGALMALLVTLFTWRPLGAVFQSYVTTKPPTKKQLEGAIAAAEELLEKYRASSHPMPSFLRRMAMSGLPYVLIGSTSTYLVVLLILKAFAIDPATLGLG